MIWWPTWKGWLLLFLVFVAPPCAWVLWGESYLSSSDRAAGAKVLVVEGWIGRVALAGAAEEFRDGGYQNVVAAGCWSEDGEVRGDWSFAQVAARELRKQGVAAEAIIEVPLGKVERQRTFKTAEAVAEHFMSEGGRRLLSDGVTVFTLGAHARRSGMVYRKVLGDEVAVGQIGWFPPGEDNERWWKSTVRGKEFITETVAYWVEVLFDGGR